MAKPSPLAANATISARPPASAALASRTGHRFGEAAAVSLAVPPLYSLVASRAPRIPAGTRPTTVLPIAPASTVSVGARLPVAATSTATTTGSTAVAESVHQVE